MNDSRFPSGISLFICLLVFITFQFVAAQSAEPWTGTVEQKAAGLSIVWAEAKYNFPFFDQRPDLDWDAKYKEYLPKALAAQDMDAYYDVLCEFAALLKDGHTAVNKPGGPFNPAFDWPTLEVQVLGDQYIVARVKETEDIKQNNIYPGLEIVEVDGQPVEAYYQSHVVKYESRGSDHADKAINIYKLLRGPKDSQVWVKVKDMDGTIRSIDLLRNSVSSTGAPYFTRLFEWYMANPPVEMKALNDGLIYIKIANFDSDNTVSGFMKLFDELDLSSVKGIVLDIRFNPGGNDQNAWPILGAFIDEPVQSMIWKSPRYVPALLAWGNEPEWETGFLGSEYIQPRDGKRYSGPLVVLTGHSTYSTAEDFLIPLDYTERAVLVGEITAGSTGNPHRVQLPGGGNFRVVTLKTLYPDGKEWVGKGIEPDIVVQKTRQDVFDGKDPVLEKGIDVLKNWKN